MSDGFFRFPHTPHLTWLGLGEPRDDKVLSGDEALALLSADVVLEEKLDGANLGFSLSAGIERASAPSPASGERSTSKVCCIPSKRVSKGSKSCVAAASVPKNSISDSMRCAISPKRSAPARRALPLSVCNTRSTSMRSPRLAGWPDH